MFRIFSNIQTEMIGGSKHYFPLDPTITDVPTLEANVIFLSLTGHGRLTGNVFIVPDNTYIMFLGEAGRSIVKKTVRTIDQTNYRFGTETEHTSAAETSLVISPIYSV